MAARHYYAVEYRHGSNMIGGEVDVYRFVSAKHRDDWVAQGSVYIGAREREAVPSDWRLVREANRKAAKGLDWPVRLVNS